MSDQILIGEIVDYHGFFGDTNEAITLVQKLNKNLQDLAKIDLKINGITDLRTLQQNIEAVAKSNRDLAQSIKDGINAQRQATSETEKNTTARKNQKAATDQNLSATEKEAKAELDAIKQKKELTRYVDQLAKQKDQMSKATVREADNLGKLNNAYEQLKKQYQIAANTAKQLAAEELKIIAAQGGNSAAAKQAAKDTEAAQKAAKGYYDQLVKVETAVGQSQRLVGQYERAQFAMNQVLREAPAFANDFRTGVMAISNNIPELIDRTKELIATNKELLAQGKQTTPVLETLGKSIFSWQTLLLIGITLLIKYGKQIGEWVSNLLTGKKAIGDVTKELELMQVQAEDTQESLEKMRHEIEFLQNLASINLDINATGQDVIANLKDQLQEVGAQSIKAREELYALGEAATQAQKRRAETLNALKDNLGDDDEKVTGFRELLEQARLPQSVVDGFSSDNKKLYDIFKSAAEDATKVENNELEKREQIRLNENKSRLAQATLDAKTAEEHRKLVLQSIELEVSIIEAGNEKILASEKSSQVQRLNAVSSNLAARKRAIEAEKNDVLNDPTATAVDKQLAVKKAGADTIKAELDNQQQQFNIREEFRKRDIEAQRAYFVQQKQMEVAAAQERSQDVHFSYGARISAIQDAFQAQKAIIDKEYQAEKDSVKNKYLTTQEKLQMEKDYESKLLQLSIDTQKAITAAELLEIQHRKELRDQALADEDTAYNQDDLTTNQTYTADVVALNEALKQKKISITKYNEDRRSLDQQFAIQQLQDLIAHMEQQLAIVDDADQQLQQATEKRDMLLATLALTKDKGKQTYISALLKDAEQEVAIAKDTVNKKIGIEKGLADAKKKLSDAGHAKDIDELLKLQARLTDLFATLASLENAINKLGDAGYDRKIQKLDDQRDALDQTYQHEVDLINASYTNQIDKQNALDAAEAQYQQKKAALDQQEKQEKLAKARFDKQAAIMAVILNTAMAVTAALGNPAKLTAAIAIGAVELAAAVAAPLPKYFRGRSASDPYVGPGIVGDGGRSELKESADGTLWVTPAVPTVTYFNKGDKVYPDARKELARRAMQATRETALPAAALMDGSWQDLRKEIKGLRQDLRSQKQPKINIRVAQVMDMFFDSDVSHRQFFKGR